MGEIIIAIILVNSEITIIQTIIFEFEDLMHLFCMSLPKKNFVTENLEISPLNNTQNGQKEMFQSKIIYRYVSSCSKTAIIITNIITNK